MMFSRTSTSLAVLLAAVVSGCNLAPVHVRPGLPVPVNVPDGGATGDVAESGALPLDWRDFVTDDKLGAVIDMAVANNRDLRVALANVDLARARYRITAADRLPSLSAGAQAGVRRTPEDALSGNPTDGGGDRVETYGLSAGVPSWELDLFGRVRNQSEASLQRYLATDLARHSVELSLSAEVATRYVALASDLERLRISRGVAAAFARTLDLVQARSQSGLGSALEVQQAVAAAADARARVDGLATLVQQDRNAIDLLAGGTVPQALLPDGLADEGLTSRDLPSNLPSTILLGRPDIQQAERELRAANADIGAARAAYFPRISLTAAAGVLSPDLGDLFDGGSDDWNVGGSASLPIFDAGRTRNGVRAAEAGRDIMVARYELAVQSGFREMADALVRRRSMTAELGARTAQRDAARAAWELSMVRYRAGVDPFLVTLDSQRGYYAAELALLDLREVREANLVELFRAAGGGFRSADGPA